LTDVSEPWSDQRLHRAVTDRALSSTKDDSSKLSPTLQTLALSSDCDRHGHGSSTHQTDGNQTQRDSASNKIPITPPNHAQFHVPMVSCTLPISVPPQTLQPRGSETCEA
jgi:hypothetical protein